ncbi:hypothetical protein AltI4_18490 [Alteromonas sp. I4]|nr:hypothetical protein AltI4_18490 [Alteromonas sp. I4]
MKFLYVILVIFTVCFVGAVYLRHRIDLDISLLDYFMLMVMLIIVGIERATKYGKK